MENRIHTLVNSIHCVGAKPTPREFTREGGIAVLDALFGEAWRSTTLGWDAKKNVKSFRGQTPESDPFKQDRAGAHYKDVQYEKIFVVDTDEDTQLARDFIRAVGPNCNCVCADPQRAHITTSWAQYRN